MRIDRLKVSIVIPTLNAGPEFEGLLRKLSVQAGDFDRELLAIDSGSTDGTLELARRYGATVYRIPKSEFDHGATRNFGISLSRGEYVALIVQDAVPLDERWLAEMIETLEHDEQVAGVYGRQIPRPESGILTRVLVNSWATASMERREQTVNSPKRYRKMSPMRRRLLAAFDNVSSCLRRSVWEEMPFEKTNFGEDLRWGKRAIEAGYKLVYEPRSAVIHSHERGALYDLRRHYVNQLIFAELFGARLVPNLKRLSLGILRSSLHLYGLLRQEEKKAGSTPRLMLLAVKHAVPIQVGTYLGAKSKPLARLSSRAFGKLDRFLSKGI